MTKSKILPLLLVVLLNHVAIAEPVDMAKRTKELQNLHWGMFICWSFSTFSGTEWTPGDEGSITFPGHIGGYGSMGSHGKRGKNGIHLIPDEASRWFLSLGYQNDRPQGHQGPLRRDLLAELRKSCDKYGIKLALYVSEGEFKDNKDYHPGGFTPEMKKAQLKELLTQYGPIKYIWFDHAQRDGGLDHEQTTAFCRALQPGCFVGFNNGPPAGDIRLGEMGHPAPLNDVKGAGFAFGDMKGYNGYHLAEFTYSIEPEHQSGAQWFYSLPRESIKIIWGL